MGLAKVPPVAVSAPIEVSPRCRYASWALTSRTAVRLGEVVSLSQVSQQDAELAEFADQAQELSC